MGKSTKQSAQQPDRAELSKQLTDLAKNVWWSWNPPAQMIFEELSPLLWESTNHNPVAILAQVSDSELNARFGDRAFLKRLVAVLESFRAYMHSRPDDKKEFSHLTKNDLIAYFCAEFGFHECLPFYSGGLGILAGDHVKSSSDLGLPLIGVGLFYRKGYFQQLIDQNGTQIENYPTTHPEMVPVDLVVNKTGKPIICSVTIGTSIVYFQGWMITVGRSRVYLLDTDVPDNAEDFRGLTGLAYGGDMNTRIRQEIILGIGGVRFLRALGISPTVFHMNEGHAAFLTLELLREYLMEGVKKSDAEKKVQQLCMFTTHTPVPAGHDRFPADLIEFTLKPYADGMELSISDLMKYGTSGDQAQQPEFTMTILGLKLSRSANAVSKKHGEVSRLMWKDLYRDKLMKKNEIGYITNGVHIPTWASRTSWEFWERHNSHAWKEHLHDPKFWEHVSDPDVVPDEELWSLRYQLRRQLIEFLRSRVRRQLAFGGGTAEEAIYHLLSFDALTIGYARRFAPYKRAPLIFSNHSRAVELFNDPQRPIQIIFSGKAHPRDTDGKEYLHKIIEITHSHPFFGKVVFLENYDMNVARYLVSGCDLWLNTPRRPLEASGTSGQKITINGGLHFSILDGWWNEAYNGKNGWAFGGKLQKDLTAEEIDKRDAESLYNVLSQEIIPAFYQQDKYGIPRKWIARLRNALRTIIPVYNTHRMVMEYTKTYYFPKRSK
jgi:starch phosphorylase